MIDARTAPEVWYASALERVRALLAEKLAGLARLNLLAPDAVLSGKLLRPRLLLSVAAAGEPLPPVDRVASLAAAVELIHLASLHHDDVLDDAPHRRQADSARAAFGNKVSILFGDALLTAALDVLLRASNRRMQAAVARALRATLRGEIAQHLGHRSVDIAESECVRVAGLKTGSLFGLSAQLGSFAGGATRDTAVLAYRLGRRLGTAFQLIDDALDYAGDLALLGKEPGSDYRQGIATLPLVCAWRGSGEPERSVLEGGFGANGGANFDAVRDILLVPRHLDRALAAAERQLRLARTLLGGLDLPDPGSLLLAFVSEIEERIPHPTHAPSVSLPAR